MDPSVDDLQSALGKESDRVRVGTAFDFKYAGCQRVWSVVVENWNCFLDDDRTFIVVVVAEMDRAPRDFASSGKDRFVNVMAVHSMPAKCWNQGGVNIHHPIFKVARNQDFGKESTEYHKVDPLFAETLKDRFAVFFQTAELFSRQQCDAQAQLLGSSDSFAVPIGDDGNDFGVELTCTDLFLQVHERCSPTGN